MPSHAQQVPYECGSCGHQGERAAWLVVDAAERPDLLEELRAGRLTGFPCDHCGATVARTTSLLVLTSGEPLFAADPTADARLTQTQLMASWMYASHGALDHIPGVLPIPHDLLPTAAGRDVAADFADWRRGTWRADTVELQRYGDWVADIAGQQDLLRVKDAVGAMTRVTSDQELAELIKNRPELLTDEADALLRSMQDVVDAEGPPEYQRAVEYWRQILRRCRRDGVERTFGHA